VQSGLRRWAKYRGYEANVVSQLVDFNPEVAAGKGFTFEDLRAEILRGYPVMLILQNPGEFSRRFPEMPRGNPNIHAMVAQRFAVYDSGEQVVQFRTSWADGESSRTWAPWSSVSWATGLTLRGVVMFRPLPKVTAIERSSGQVTLRWDGPSSVLWDEANQVETPAHAYIVESSAELNGHFSRVGDLTYDREVTFPDPGADHRFFRVKLIYPAYDGVGYY
jgi:hypothetical protein